MNVHGSTSIARAKGVFINNAWSDASSGRSLPVIAPAEGRQFAEIAAGDAINALDYIDHPWDEVTL
jgi:aldehyde dehydrogenase (NAD+)